MKKKIFEPLEMKQTRFLNPTAGNYKTIFIEYFMILRINFVSVSVALRSFLRILSRCASAKARNPAELASQPASSSATPSIGSWAERWSTSRRIVVLSAAARPMPASLS